MSKLPNRTSYVEYVARRTGRYYHGKLPHDHVYSVHSAVLLLDVCGFQVVEAGTRNILPLTQLGRRLAPARATRVWQLNNRMAQVPGLRLLSTNVDVVAGKAADAPGRA